MTFKNIRPRDTVRFLIPAGKDRFGNQEWRGASGRAVIVCEDHVTVNAGGRYGTPQVVTDENFLSAKTSTGRTIRADKW